MSLTTPAATTNSVDPGGFFMPNSYNKLLESRGLEIPEKDKGHII